MKYNTSELFETELINIRKQLNLDLERLKDYENIINKVISHSKQKDEIKAAVKASKIKLKHQIRKINEALIRIR